MRFADVTGEAVDVVKAPQRSVAGPTIQTGAQLRRARDLLMVVAETHGYNVHDLRLIFGLSRSQTYERIAAVKAYSSHLARSQRV